MIIGIDGNEANVEKKVGISEYAFELLQQFYQLQNPQISWNVYLKHQPNKAMPKSRNGWKYHVVGPKKLWTQIGLPFHLYTHSPRPAVFFSPTHYAPRYCPVPSIVSVMDTSYIYFPELFKPADLYQLKHWTAYSVQNAARVLTISQASKDDIMNLYNIPENKVIVTYPGIKQEQHHMHKETLTKKYGIPDTYILFVGTLQPRKNITALIEAYAQLVQQKVIENTPLVIVGKKGWLYEDILAAPEKFGVAQEVKFLEFVPNEELTVLYQHALFFVLPSLYEGFGLPVLEAMKHGCPVITSNVSSLPEAGGDAALYVDPKSVDDIASKMKELYTSKKLQETLREKGLKQVKKFSWGKTAQQTLAVLQEVTHNER